MEKSKQLKILAIDQASSCGWCCGDDLYGCWNLTTRRDESIGSKLLRFKAKLKEIINLEQIGLIVYERVAGQHATAIIHASKMVAIIETLCEEIGIQYTAYSATEIKRFATGKGNANKDAMVKAAQEKYGYDGTDDNIADAIHIYQLAKQNYL